MNAKAMLTAFFAFAGVLAAMFPVFSQQSPPDSEKSKQVMALVDKAAAMIDKQGSLAFSELGNPVANGRLAISICLSAT